METNLDYDILPRQKLVKMYFNMENNLYFLKYFLKKYSRAFQIHTNWTRIWNTEKFNYKCCEFFFPNSNISTKWITISIVHD